jgi:hypothetical protein
MTRLHRSHAPVLFLAPLLAITVACGGSDDAATDAPASSPVATGVGADPAAVDTSPPGGAGADTLPTDMTLPPAPVAPSVVATPADICALLTADEVAAAVTADGFDPGAFTFAAPQVSASGYACSINAAGAGVIDLLPSEFYGDQATMLMSYPAGQVVSEGVVFVPDSATVQSWIMLSTGAPVEVSTSLSFEFTPTILAALAAALQS